MLGEDVAQVRQLLRRRSLHAEIAQAKPQRIHPRQILPAVSLAHGSTAASARASINLDVQRQTRRRSIKAFCTLLGLPADA